MMLHCMHFTCAHGTTLLIFKVLHAQVQVQAQCVQGAAAKSAQVVQTMQD